ncbi:tetraspanin-31 isoform X2 [Bacillus rossius redtenbacheri]|uniref:tetraspanin-31 isoform X2 n=1 Tax=Bacillus rossius redtenbacheri TaxID=93214 RepID=UPI002FDCD7CF
MCGGFTCSKNALTALNILYILVAFILIGVAVYGRTSSAMTDLPIIGGILACGVFLILVSILGLIGAIKHHQVILFFYMLILFLLFLVQFSVACACLAVNREQQKLLAEDGLKTMTLATKSKVEKAFNCCLVESIKVGNTTISPLNPACNGSLPSCTEKLQDTINYAFKLCGGIGMFFSFTEFVGVWLTVRYRNQKDPRANPSAFL